MTVDITLTNDDNHPGALGTENSMKLAVILRDITDESLAGLFLDQDLHKLDLDVVKREALRRFCLRALGEGLDEPVRQIAGGI